MPTQGEFSNQPTVILITGTTARRFHVLFEFLYLLLFKDHEVVAFSASLDKHELSEMQQALLKPNLLYAFTENSFRGVFDGMVKPTEKKKYILIEADLDKLFSLSFSNLHVQTLVLTDIAIPERDMGIQVQEYLAGQVRKSTEFQTLLYNNDVYRPEHTEKEWALIRADEIPVKKTYRYGKNSTSDIRFAHDAEVLFMQMPNFTFQTKALRPSSSSLLEGVYGAFALAMLEQVLEKQDDVSHIQRVPLFEEYRTDKDMYGWMKYYWYPEDMRSLLLAFPRVCMGMSVYLRFEQVIESMIEEMEHILIVPESQNQEDLLSEYFLQKEKDSYHTILFVPPIEEIPKLVPSMFGDEPRAYLFDQLESFARMRG